MSNIEYSEYNLRARSVLKQCRQPVSSLPGGVTLYFGGYQQDGI